MRTAPRLAVYGVALIAAFGAAFGLGRTVGPVDADAPAGPRPALDGTSGSEHGEHGEDGEDGAGS